MSATGSSIPALVILPHNFLGDANQAPSGEAIVAADTLPVHASDLDTAQWQNVL